MFWQVKDNKMPAVKVIMLPNPNSFKQRVRKEKKHKMYLPAHLKNAMNILKLIQSTSLAALIKKVIMTS